MLFPGTNANRAMIRSGGYLICHCGTKPRLFPGAGTESGSFVNRPYAVLAVLDATSSG